VAAWIETDWIETRVMETRVEADREDGSIAEIIDPPTIQVIILHLVPLALGNQIITIIMTIYLNGR
jgi:hypothetical protein